MTPDQMAQLTAVNEEVNVLPYDAAAGPGEPPDWWTDQPMAGNSFVCRDYVQLKAHKLKALGWPASALTTILCYTEPPDSGYHAVLGVEVDGDLWILDSRMDAPYSAHPPLPMAYRGDRRQVPGTTEFEPFAFT